MADRQFGDAPLMRPLTEGIILERTGAEVDGMGQTATNVPHHVVHHSPDGYEWGYGGSGPADLALNIVESILHHLGWIGQRTECHDGSCFELAWMLHQPFKWLFIAPASKEGALIPWDNAETWVISAAATRGIYLVEGRQ